MFDFDYLKLGNYKSLSPDCCIDINSNISLFIGINNTGKSSCLDIVGSLYDNDYLYDYNNSISLGLKLTHSRYDRWYKNMRQRVVGLDKYFDKYLLIDTSCRKDYLTIKRKFSLSNNQPYIEDEHLKLTGWNSFIEPFNRANPFENYIWCRLDADRDIKPEQANDIDSLSRAISPNGDGATNLIRMLINKSSLDEKVIEVTVLNELNTIMADDGHFSAIRIQEIDSEDLPLWEVFLEEASGKRFPLSNCGSGLKTVILVLLMIYGIPALNAKDKKYVFGFEELENNLHPALQRRLIHYIIEYSINNNVQFYITSHSNIVINELSKCQKAIIYHVEKAGTLSSVSKMEDFKDNIGLLNDLGVRASDILQSNGIVWVEGPSDRIYIEKWLDLFCNNRYEEGIQYQYLYYGGRLLNHYSADSRDIINLISILKTNHNSFIVMDSDKKYPQTPINDTKKRIISEVEKNGSKYWLTKGKEIENYLPASVIEETTNGKIKTINQFEAIGKTYQKKTNKSIDKIAFAKDATQLLTVQNSKDILDLKKQVESLYKVIESWNNI